MSHTQTEDQDVREHQEEVAGLLPALAQLDRTVAELEEKTASGREVTAADVSAYEQQAAHARHLVDAAGADHREVAEAEKEHRGDGDKGFATRAMEHAAHPRSFEPTPPPADNGQDRDRDDDEEIDL
ncbi:MULTISPECIES: hypothetical protein [Streptomyces]|uniref:hypothetical protein n=1 Tax=Streptomyces TaxID=1883 RepID=UPI000BF23539|nr:hypothetical protein [Streptomyces sp. wa1063]WTE08785.1 hypothetical protein OH765_40100 [Streptomyces anulatus]WTE31788.1 hypothetical protein OHB50_39630 [Streptomyces anulatus]